MIACDVPGCDKSTEETPHRTPKGWTNVEVVVAGEHGFGALIELCPKHGKELKATYGAAFRAAERAAKTRLRKRRRLVRRLR